MPGRACIICGKRSIAGLSRCNDHRRGGNPGPNPYDAEHQRLAKECLSQRPLICHLCGLGVEAVPERGPFQADHIVPRSLGGQNVRSNYAPAHGKCNVAKGGRNRLRPSR